MATSKLKMYYFPKKYLTGERREIYLKNRILDNLLAIVMLVSFYVSLHEGGTFGLNAVWFENSQQIATVTFYLWLIIIFVSIVRLIRQTTKQEHIIQLVNQEYKLQQAQEGDNKNNE